MLKIVYIHLYNIFVSLLLKCGLDLSWRRYFISENMATCSLIATGLIFYDLRPMECELRLKNRQWNEPLNGLSIPGYSIKLKIKLENSSHFRIPLIQKLKCT